MKILSSEKTEPQNKVIRLFTYLEKVLALDDSVVRDFRITTAAPSPWWLADLPRDVENLYLRPFETEIKEESSPSIDAWLRVEKKSHKPAPALPKELEEWIGDINPIDAPRAKEKIDRKIPFEQNEERIREFKKFRKEFQQGDSVPDILKEWVVLSPDKLPEAITEKYVEDAWNDHPELHSLLFGYVENDWSSWAERVRKIYKANQLYDQLYALRLLLKNEGDNYELLLGHGLLAWKHSAVGTVYAPIFLTPLTLDFDPAKRIIEISPDPMFRGFVEISSLYEMDNPAEIDLITWSDKINSDPFDFWHLESLKVQSQTLINYLSPESEDCFEEDMVASPEANRAPGIWNAPVIFARKRTNDLWSKYANIIRRDIEQNNIEPTEFISDLVGDYEEVRNVGTGESGADADAEAESQDLTISDAELCFPLPWNDEQKRIVERLEVNYGVVVKGPPGTGKSHTIANLISRFLAQGKSVLVTSQHSKALEVLRGKLPENIRSLAVSQLHQTAKRDDVLQQSVSEISSNLGERHTKFSEQRAENVRKELKRVREDRASLSNEIRQYILIDSSAKIDVDGQEIRPIDAAKLVSKYADDKDLAWFTDKIHFQSQIAFKQDDLKELDALLRELGEEERKLYRFNLPELSILPNEDVALGAFSSYRDLSLKAQVADKIFNGANDNISSDELFVLWNKLGEAKRVLVSISEGYPREIFDQCVLSKNEREKWQSVLLKIAEKTQIIGKSRNMLIGHEVQGDTSLAVDDFMEAVKILEKKVANGSHVGTFTKLLLPANARTVLEAFVIDGKSPDNAGRVGVLVQYALAAKAEKDVQILLIQSFATLKSNPGIKPGRIDLVRLEVLIASLQRIVAYTTEFSAIDDFCKNVKEFSDLSFARLSDVEQMAELIASMVAKFDLANLEKTFLEWIAKIEGIAPDPRHPIAEKLIETIRKHNSAGYKNAINEVALLADQKTKASHLQDISKKIQPLAPNLYIDIVGLADQGIPFQCPDNLDLAWKIARLSSWLDDIHNHADIDELQGRLERLTKKEFQLNSEFVTILAWQRQIDKVTKKQRDALMAWSLAMKKYGKGTGKYAVTHLRAAQDALKEAKNAVPVWIMPLHRAAQMFSDPKAGIFDVVIFDEASQCDIKGIMIAYLGKKLLVVGDPEQISPAGIFQDQEKIFELISRFLYDIPFKESFSITSSLFDLAKIRLANIIQLNEHFRCVPEIIAFSNHHIYEGKLKPLRYPNPQGLLKPALVPVFIKEGYQNTNNKVNEPEAEAIVNKLVECLKDSRYQKRPDGRLCTFGIISLLAEDQAKYIEKLIRGLIAQGIVTEKEIEERQIACGDAYRFQGDERDVIFLSMVRALDPKDPHATVAPLTSEDAKRRFNVAASRARDQMFLFYSIPLESFENRNDWRYKLLAWFYDPKKEELKAGREVLKKEFDSGRASQFSVDVGNLLINRGYQVLPEYPVIGYRIDLVVQGEDARLAVECDGDQYHTLENWDEDQTRERQLRRAGWEFWRITGSAFYCNKEKALDSLWKKLEGMGIKPIVGQ